MSDDKNLVQDFEIVYEIIQKSEYGEIVLAGNSDYPVTSFSQQDVSENRLAFRQKKEIERVTIFKVKVQATNSVTQNQETFDITFTSSPENIFAPTIELGQPIVVNEGTDILLSSDYFTARHHKYDSSNLVCHVARNPTTGGGYFTVNKLRRTQFTVSELQSGSVKYTHNGDDEYWDNVVLIVKAGENETRVLLQILINPIDDQFPFSAKNIQLNKYLTLVGSNWKTISPRDIFYQDKDSSIENIMYSLKINSHHNISFRRVLTRSLQKYENDISNWTQIEIIRGNIQCRNLLSSFNTTTVDVRLDVSDNAIFPNHLRHLLNVKLVHLDEEAPTFSEWALMFVEVDEYRPTIIGKKSLEYIDSGTLTPIEIKFKVTTRPYDRNPDNPLKVGQLCLSQTGSAFDTLNCNVQYFTQKDVNDRKLFYLPPISERGVITRFIEFVFSVTDSAGNTRQNQYFNVNLKPLSNSPPRVYVKHFRLQPNSDYVINHHDFEVIDPEGISAAELVFTVRQFPAKIQILRDGVSMSKRGITTFKAADLTNQRISFQVGDFVNFQDNFEAVLTDGVNLVPIKVPISIDSFNEYSIHSQTFSDFVRISIYVRQSSAVALTLVRILFQFFYSKHFSKIDEIKNSGMLILDSK